MVVMLNQSSADRSGYTNAVDWWSLGITVFKLLTGYKPFELKKKQTIAEDASLFPEPKREFPEYSILFDDIIFPRYITPIANAFITSLLSVSETDRLGYGINGAENVKKHPFFEGIVWDKLVTKHQVPPFLPDPQPIEEIPVYENFASMMQNQNKSNWLVKLPSASRQKYFDNWYVTVVFCFLIYLLVY